ncbi:uncharacterized protein JCM6883_001769 [Sporobolomyces salmoneus]|uniref:uncharacterized protein n=1 Tax=Sporobolomyces salmoneus TaxID=183962 RepID=UPI00317AF8DB
MEPDDYHYSYGGYPSHNVQTNPTSFPNQAHGYFNQQQAQSFALPQQSHQMGYDGYGYGHQPYNPEASFAAHQPTNQGGSFEHLSNQPGPPSPFQAPPPHPFPLQHQSPVNPPLSKLEKAIHEAKLEWKQLLRELSEMDHEQQADQDDKLYALARKIEILDEELSKVQEIRTTTLNALKQLNPRLAASLSIQPQQSSHASLKRPVSPLQTSNNGETDSRFQAHARNLEQGKPRQRQRDLSTLSAQDQVEVRELEQKVADRANAQLTRARKSLDRWWKKKNPGQSIS